LDTIRALDYPGKVVRIVILRPLSWALVIHLHGLQLHPQSSLNIRVLDNIFHPQHTMVWSSRKYRKSTDRSMKSLRTGELFQVDKIVLVVIALFKRFGHNLIQDLRL